MKKIGVSLCLLAVALPLVGTGGASAQSGGRYDLSWSTVDGGGYTWSQGGGYCLGGTIGQADAGPAAAGTCTLLGGFWGGATALQYRIYLPLVLRNA